MGRWRAFFKQRFGPQDNSGSIERNVVPPSISASGGASEDAQDQSFQDASIDDHHYDSLRGDHFWNRVKKRYQLVDFHALPEYLRGNEFILRHYRADWPLKETLLSIFRIHNETLNIWTHLIGFLLFLGLTIYTAWQIPKVEHPTLSNLTTLPTLRNLNKLQAEIMACFPPLPPFAPAIFRYGFSPHVTKDHPMVSFVSSPPRCIVRTIKDDIGKLLAPIMRKPTTRWPFFIFLGGAMLCLLTSSFCHLLCCHSSRLSYFLWRCDYAGIAAMIATSFFPPVYYTFMCHPKWRNFYLTSISVIGVLILMVTISPPLQKNKYRILKTLLFCGMGVCGIIPCIHKLISHKHEEASYDTTAHEVIMGLFYGIGAVFYTTRIPERWMPGSFDIAGHSHQIFHVLVVCGAYTHYKAALLYIEWRDKHGCD